MERTTAYGEGKRDYATAKAQGFLGTWINPHPENSRAFQDYADGWISARFDALGR